MVEGRLPTVIEYYSEYISNGVNLAAAPKQCCPFHKEDTPSFSYNINTGRWFCFGRCHRGGDVIDMHQLWFHFNTRAEAENDLRIKYNARKSTTLQDLANEERYIPEDNILNNVTYARALALANTPERWLELDYAMSKAPYDRLNLLDLIAKWAPNDQF